MTDFLDFLRSALPVAVVLGLLAALLHFARKRGLVVGTSSSDGSLAVVQRVRLTPHHYLHRVQTERETLWIATSQTGCTLVDFERTASGSPKTAQERGAAC